MGIGFWPDDRFDGKYLTAIKDGFSMVANVEGFYFSKEKPPAITVKPAGSVFEKSFTDEGKTVKVVFPNYGDSIQYTTHKNKDATVLTLFNYHEACDAVLRVSGVSLTEGQEYIVQDPTTETLYTNNKNEPLGRKDIENGFLTLVPKNGVVLLKIDRRAENSVKSTTVRQSFFEMELAKQKAGFAQCEFYQPRKGKHSEAGWGDGNGDDIPDVKLETSRSKAYVSLEQGARVVAWKKTGMAHSDILLHNQDRGFLGDLIMYDDAVGNGSYPFQLKDLKLNEDMPEACFNHVFTKTDGANPTGFPLEGLQVVKRIALIDNGCALKIHFTFTNKNPQKREIPLGFRIKNRSKVGGAFAGLSALSQISQITFTTPNGKMILSSANIKSDNNVFLLPSLKGLTYWKSMVTPRPWMASPICVEANCANSKDQMVFEPDKTMTAGCYVWWSKSADFTIELLSFEKPLSHGASCTYEYIIRHSW